MKVTQEDRDVAADYYYSAGGLPDIARQIREGTKDNWFRVQAFAYHRHQAQEAGRREGLREAAGVARRVATESILACDSEEARIQHRGIVDGARVCATAIEALMQEEG